MRVNILGPLELAAGSAARTPLRSRNLRRLLAGLLVDAGNVVSLDRLADIVWADAPPGDVDAAMHTLISRLRATLRNATADIARGASPAVELLTRAPGYVLRVDRDALDAAEFEDLLRTGRAALPAQPDDAGRTLDRALGLWRGDAYAEFASDDFARAEAARLEELRLVAVEERAQAALLLGRHDEAIGWLQPLVTAQPARERPRGQLMVALYNRGRHADALAVFDEYRRWMDDELGLEPSSDLQQLQVAVLRRDPSLHRPDGEPNRPADADLSRRRPSGPAPAPTGEHDDGAPQRRAARHRPAGNLPVALGELVGREEMLSHVAVAVRASRVVTLTGPGGVGKTRLALGAASDLVADDHRGSTQALDLDAGAWLVELGAIDASANLVDVVASTLAVQQRVGLAPTERLVEYLRAKALLLVVDNCEHVIESAAALIDAITRGCPTVRVLATSREPLEIPGEHVVTVPPLAVPSLSADDAAGVTRAASGMLFVQRAHASAGFSLTDDNAVAVAEICRRLDGLPLAIELAATRLRSMSAHDVVDRLASRFGLLTSGRRVGAERHRTLRAVVDWSYRLLSATEQRAFDRLSVFAGSFSLDAAEYVIGYDELGRGTDRHVTDELLAGLVDKSMLTVARAPNSTRFGQLETLRAFGRERLTERGETNIAQRAHATHHVDVVERAAVQLNGPGHVDAADAIGRELAELRAAHAWAVAHDLDLALRLVAALVDYVEHRPRSEIFTWADRTVAEASGSGIASDFLPAVYAVAASGARSRGDLPRANELANVGLSSCAEPDDPVRRFLLYLLSDVAFFEGRLADFRQINAEIKHLAVHAGDVMRTAWAELLPALASAYAGDYAGAVAEADRLVEWADRTDHPAAIAWARYVAGEVRMTSDPDRAMTLLDDALARARSAGDAFLSGVALVSVASMHARHGDRRRAAALFGDVIEYWHAAGNWTQQWTTLRNVIDLLMRVGEHYGAAALLGALDASDTAAPVFGDDADRLDAVRTRLARALSAAELAAATAEGAGLRDEGAMRLALDLLKTAANGGPVQRPE